MEAYRFKCKLNVLLLAAASEPDVVLPILNDLFEVGNKRIIDVKIELSSGRIFENRADVAEELCAEVGDGMKG